MDIYIYIYIYIYYEYREYIRLIWHHYVMVLHTRTHIPFLHTYIVLKRYLMYIYLSSLLYRIFHTFLTIITTNTFADFDVHSLTIHFTRTHFTRFSPIYNTQLTSLHDSTKYYIIDCTHRHHTTTVARPFINQIHQVMYISTYTHYIYYIHLYYRTPS